MGQKVTLGESQELFLFGAYHKYWEIKGMHIFFRYSGVGGDKCQGNSSKSEKQLKKKKIKFIFGTFFLHNRPLTCMWWHRELWSQMNISGGVPESMQGFLWHVFNAVLPEDPTIPCIQRFLQIIWICWFDYSEII